MEKTINTEKIEKAINHLIKVVDEELEKNEPRSFDKFVDIINKKMGDEIYQSRAGELMDFIYELSEPEYEKRRLCLSSALIRANDNAVFLLDNLTGSALQLHKCVHNDELDIAHIRAEARQLKSFTDEVQEEILCELFDRVQGYRSDIEKLKNGNSHAKA